MIPIGELLDSATAIGSLVALQEVAMAVEAFIHFEKALPTMADVKGESVDPSFKSYFELKDFSSAWRTKPTSARQRPVPAPERSSSTKSRSGRSPMPLHRSSSGTVRPARTTNW